MRAYVCVRACYFVYICEYHFVIIEHKRFKHNTLIAGTNGGVTFAGLLFSLLGGLVIGLAYYVTLIYTVDSLQLHRSPPQWPVILWGGFAGLVGSVIDSFLGATLQYSGMLLSRSTVLVLQFHM